MKGNGKRAVIATSAVGMLVVVVMAARALAVGIPATNALSYTGTLEDATGAALGGMHNIEVKLWNVGSGGMAALCTTNSQPVMLERGRFSVPLPDACVAAVKANADVWVEVLDGGMSLGRTKVGAVPFAVEADRAQSATAAAGTLAEQIVPAGMVGMFVSACPAGWIACDGAGACPNLNGAYIKGGTAYAAMSGANMHMHSVTAMATAAGGGYTPEAAQASFTTSAAGAHHHVAEITWGGGEIQANLATEASWMQNKHTSLDVLGSTVNMVGPGGEGALTTDAPTHTHTVSVSMKAVPEHTHAIPSFTVPAVSHEPVHASLVFCMKT